MRLEISTGKCLLTKGALFWIRFPFPMCWSHMLSALVSFCKTLIAFLTRIIFGALLWWCLGPPQLALDWRCFILGVFFILIIFFQIFIGDFSFDIPVLIIIWEARFTIMVLWLTVRFLMVSICLSKIVASVFAFKPCALPLKPIKIPKLWDKDPFFVK